MSSDQLPKYNVVVQTAFIGDLYLSIPTLKRLRALFPETKIILVCKKGLKDYFLRHGLVDLAFEVIKGDRSSYRAALNQMNVLSLDTVFCLHRSVRSSFFCRQLKAQYKVAFASVLNQFIFDRTETFERAWPEVIRQLNLLRSLDASLATKLAERDWTYLNFKNEQGVFDNIPEEFSMSQTSDPSASLRSTMGKVALFPGSVWATKKWSDRGFADVATALIERGYEVSIMGGPDDMPSSLAVFHLEPRAQFLTGKLSLADSTEYLQDCLLVVCNDSAPAHMAALQQRPVLVIFGPTVLDFGFRPWNDKSDVVENNAMECRPCGAHGHHACPLKHHNCMKSITSAEVLEKALLLLA